MHSMLVTRFLFLGLVFWNGI